MRKYSVLPNDPCKGVWETHNPFSFMPLKIFSQRKKNKNNEEKCRSVKNELRQRGQREKGEKSKRGGEKDAKG